VTVLIDPIEWDVLGAWIDLRVLVITVGAAKLPRDPVTVSIKERLNEA
jgi:hypothetical protein